MVDIDTDNNYDIDNAWSLFCKYGNINDEVVEHKVNSDKKPIASDIYISTLRSIVCTLGYNRVTATTTRCPEPRTTIAFPSYSIIFSQYLINIQE
jgi:hypothetical protein